LNAKHRGRLYACCLAAGVFAAGCRQDMHDQPKFKPYAKNDFFADRRARVLGGQDDRPRPPARGCGSVPQGRRQIPWTPFRSASAAVMARGQERFDIFCSPCHGGRAPATA
jgi:hypothetical protein